MPEASKFKQENSFEDRKKETVKIMKKYDDRIPIIIERRQELIFLMSKKQVPRTRYSYCWSIHFHSIAHRLLMIKKRLICIY